jgi:hypothetical protein
MNGGSALPPPSQLQVLTDDLVFRASSIESESSGSGSTNT